MADLKENQFHDCIDKIDWSEIQMDITYDGWYDDFNPNETDIDNNYNTKGSWMSDDF